MSEVFDLIVGLHSDGVIEVSRCYDLSASAELQYWLREMAGGDNPNGDGNRQDKAAHDHDHMERKGKEGTVAPHDKQGYDP